jgi:GNAT superfamily N-acetyltransferase
MIEDKTTFRTEVLESDIKAVEKLVVSTGFFRDDEVKVAVEIVEERIKLGKDSGYEFIFIEINGEVAAYVCFGLIPCSLISYDLYWIVTGKSFQQRGLGQLLIQKTEEFVKATGGKAIYIETSSKPLYKPTQQFYYKAGYILKATYEDFYDNDDDKLVFVKKF